MIMELNRARAQMLHASTREVHSFNTRDQMKICIFCNLVLLKYGDLDKFRKMYNSNKKATKWREEEFKPAQTNLCAMAATSLE